MQAVSSHEPATSDYFEATECEHAKDSPKDRYKMYCKGSEWICVHTKGQEKRAIDEGYVLGTATQVRYFEPTPCTHQELKHQYTMYWRGEHDWKMVCVFNKADAEAASKAGYQVAKRKTIYGEYSNLNSSLIAISKVFFYTHSAILKDKAKKIMTITGDLLERSSKPSSLVRDVHTHATSFVTIDRTDAKGYTPLMQAIVAKSEFDVVAMLEKGADPNLDGHILVVDKHGNPIIMETNPLFFSIEVGLPGISRILLSWGADLGTVSSIENSLVSLLKLNTDIANEYFQLFYDEGNKKIFERLIYILEAILLQFRAGMEFAIEADQEQFAATLHKQDLNFAQGKQLILYIDQVKKDDKKTFEKLEAIFLMVPRLYLSFREHEGPEGQKTIESLEALYEQAKKLKRLHEAWLKQIDE